MSNLVAILAVDPGGVTGWSWMVLPAECLCDPNTTMLDRIRVWEHGQIDSRELGENQAVGTLLDTRNDLADATPAAEVFHLTEDFILRKFLQGREVLSPVRITAAWEYVMGCHNWNYSHNQTSEEAMRTATDARLKEWGLYERKGGMGHARDADRHAITWLRKAKASPVLRSQCWPQTFDM